MSNGMQVFNYKDTEVRTVERAGEVWFVASDVCRVLELENPTEAIRPLDEDEKNTLRISEGNRGNPNVNIISESGIYALVFRSNKPEAKAFSKWVRSEVLPQIRRTGSYNVHAINDELNIRKAELLQSMIGMCPMTDETKTVFIHEAYKALTGQTLLSMLLESKEKWYIAHEIGEAIGISANRVGRIAKANGIKALEGKSNKYGRWIFSKSRYSNREVASFIYTDAALEWFKENRKGVSVMKTVKPVSQETYECIGKAYTICSQYPEVFGDVTFQKFCKMFVDDIIDEGEDIISARKRAHSGEMYDLLELAIDTLREHTPNSLLGDHIEALLDRIDNGEEDAEYE